MSRDRLFHFQGGGAKTRLKLGKTFCDNGNDRNRRLPDNLGDGTVCLCDLLFLWLRKSLKRRLGFAAGDGVDRELSDK